MRLLIDGGGYATAATAFADANHAAAAQYDVLTGRLSGLGAMAGDDATSVDFAAAYDEAAAAALGAHVSLVGALAGLGRLTEQSLRNHHDAEQRSVLPGAVVHTGGPLPEHGYVAVLPTTPPGSAGGTAPSFSQVESWVLHHVEGFVWPNADVARLREAAAVWRGAAESLDDLSRYCDAAMRGLEAQRSPEVPYAVNAVGSLRATADDLAAQYAALAASCDSYAGAVEQTHARTRAVLAVLVQMAVESAVIGGLASLASAGLGAGAGGALLLARISAKAPELRALLAALRVEAAATAATVRATGARLHSVKQKLGDFLGFPKGIAAERGSVRLVPFRPRDWPRGFLTRHEGPDRGHCIKKHVGKNDDELAARFTGRRPPEYASTFPDEATAERAIAAVLDKNWSRVQEFLASDVKRLVVEGPVSASPGISMKASGEVLDATRVRVLIDQDPHMPEGFLIRTAYPTP
ncbi:RNase A-like domain-containing protein [Nocardioides sp. GCM10027113]|uniref:RNase A-like domain-containing protein n=1 Tax=unclassified Nocardioides TaxID=2615069 RepID=UPI0036111975